MTSPDNGEIEQCPTFPNHISDRDVSQFQLTMRRSWTVHDGRFFSDNLLSRTPRAPNEREWVRNRFLGTVPEELTCHPPAFPHEMGPTSDTCVHGGNFFATYGNLLAKCGSSTRVPADSSGVHSTDEDFSRSLSGTPTSGEKVASAEEDHKNGSAMNSPSMTPQRRNVPAKDKTDELRKLFKDKTDDLRKFFKWTTADSQDKWTEHDGIFYAAHADEWTVHDGQFFSNAVRNGRPRVPNERRCTHDESKLSWTKAVPR
eukprot:CAMPEP_0119340262 /NCGR_PEP_ID=MMETSP1333-20130426/99977_1 /TAXON_ID=418940 /ORGANISM="Scyphosphaera apsteinii, Strain RCC1455" /LENGTH=257 /DNA_ID=CAMNT_0007351975 /DNA_START=106 /DNA_END=879 /DNA_ORIENTATION=-